MTLRLEQIDGASFAPEASNILKEAWANQPSIEYSPDYIAWQLSFPGSIAPVAVAAFDGTEPIGFAAATVRRLRLDLNEADGFVTSFWSMRPGRGGPAGAILLLEALLRKLRRFDVPVLTFGLHNGRGERLFPQSYVRSGFLDTMLGKLPTYAFLVRSEPQTASDWIVAEAESTAILYELVSQCASKDPTLLYVASDSTQLEHYSKDPRSRHLLVATDSKTGSRAAAWAIRTGFRTAEGVSYAPSLENVALERSRADALPALLIAASELYSSTIERPVVVNAPSLAGFDAKALRSLGIRQTSNGFHGHLYLPPSRTEWQSTTGTASEII
jgi:hypothetical protein